MENWTPKPEDEEKIAYWVNSFKDKYPEYYKVTPYVKNGVKNALKGLIILPFAMLAWDYYKSRDVRKVSHEAMECFAWPAGIFVVKHFRPNPF